MQQATVLAALLLVVIICCVHSSPYGGGRDFDVPFRKKPFRRGGCDAYGHSCFGGHGKRSSDPGSLMGPQLQQVEQRLHQSLPNSDLFKQWLQAYRGSLDGQ